MKTIIKIDEMIYFFHDMSMNAHVFIVLFEKCVFKIKKIFKAYEKLKIIEDMHVENLFRKTFKTDDIYFENTMPLIIIIDNYKTKQHAMMHLDLCI